MWNRNLPPRAENLPRQMGSEVSGRKLAVNINTDHFNPKQVAGDDFNQPSMIDGNLIKFSDDVFALIFLEIYNLGLYRRVTEI